MNYENEVHGRAGLVESCPALHCVPQTKDFCIVDIHWYCIFHYAIFKNRSFFPVLLKLNTSIDVTSSKIKSKICISN